MAANGNLSLCTQQAPCSLEDYAEEWVRASNEVKAGDTVLLAGSTGTYGSPGTPITFQVPVPEGVTFTGTPGQPMPQVYSKYSSGAAFELKGPSSALSDIDIEYSASAQVAVFANAGIVNRVIAHSTAGAWGCQLSNSATITDSVCAGTWALVVGGGGVTKQYTVRNTTLFGSEFGLWATASGGLNAEIAATNTIIRGGVKDIYAEAASGAAVNAALEHSNYASVEEAGAGTKVVTVPGTNFNQTAEPKFVNLAAGDFHEAPGSPTIDAGINSALNGSLDLEGNPREIASHTDIGAYEFLIPPAALTAGATGVAPSSATLNGTVNPNGLATSFHFVYGTTTAYGSATAATSAGSGTAATGVSASLAGLAPNTTYHYQLLASNSAGASSGGDRTFSTPPITAIAPIGTPIATIATIARLSETNKTFAPEGTSTPLTGSTSSRHRPKRAKRGTIFSFTLDQAANVTVEIQRTGSGRRVGHTCRVSSKRRHHKPKCTLYTTVRTLTRVGHVGLNKLPFTGRIAGKALKPGHYRALVSATDAAGVSKAQAIGFTIVAP